LAYQAKISLLEKERNFLTHYIMGEVKRNKLIKLDRVSPIKPNFKISNVSNIDKSPIKRMATDIDVSNKRVSSQETRSPWRLRNEKSFVKDEIFKVTRLPEHEIDLNNPIYAATLQKLEEFLLKLKEKDWENRLGILQEVEGFYKDLIIGYEIILRDLKEKYEREKTKMKAQLAAKLVGRNQLEDFFLDCVNKVKGMIIRRRALSKNASNTYEKKSAREELPEYNIENDEFLNSDKQKVLELFLSNETVIRAIRYLTFWAGEKKDLRSNENSTKGITEEETSFFTNMINDSFMNLSEVSHQKGNKSFIPDISSVKLPQLADSRVDTSTSAKITDPEASRKSKLAQLFEPPQPDKSRQKRSKSVIKDNKKTHCII